MAQSLPTISETKVLTANPTRTLFGCKRDVFCNQQHFDPQSGPISRPAYVIAHYMMAVNQFTSREFVVLGRLARSK